MKIRLILIALVLMRAVVARAGQADTNLATLKAAEWFALGGIGVAGTTSKEEIALRSVMDEPDAAARLKTLLAEGNMAGQCYALLGLRLPHDPAYEQNIARYKSNKAMVKTVAGCSISDQSVASVSTNLDAGRLDPALSGPVH